MNAIDLLASLKGKTVTGIHIGSEKGTGRPVMVTLWFDSGPPVLFESDDEGLVVSIDELDEHD